MIEADPKSRRVHPSHHSCFLVPNCYFASAVEEPKVPIDQKDGHRTIAIILELEEDKDALKETNIALAIESTVEWA
jgi:hypothetical protein